MIGWTPEMEPIIDGPTQESRIAVIPVSLFLANKTNGGGNWVCRPRRHRRSVVNGRCYFRFRRA